MAFRFIKRLLSRFRKSEGTQVVAPERHLRPLPSPPIVVRRRRKPHDVSRFMKKHGRWSKHYRASVKANIKPEEA